MNASAGFVLNRLLSFVLTLALLSTPLAHARSGPKDQVAAATAKWGEVFVDDNPDPILALYGKDAVLWGTLSPTVRNTPELIREYFEKAFKALPGHKVAFGEQLIRIYGNTAINTGYYTFSYTKDGEAKTIPALQLRLRQTRAQMGDRRPPFLRDARAAEVIQQVSAVRRDGRQRRRRAVLTAACPNPPGCGAAPPAALPAGASYLRPICG